MSGSRGDRWLRRAVKGERLSVALRFSPTPIRVRALREIWRAGRTGAVPLVPALLQHPAPGVRRAAALVLGHLGGRAHIDTLLGHAISEPTDEARLALAAAAVRLGLPPAEGWTVVASWARRTIATWYGRRDAAAAVGVGPSERARRWLELLDPLSSAVAPDRVRPRAAAEVRPLLMERLRADPEDRPTLLALGAQGHPDDLARLLERLKSDGRRATHAVTTALGHHGDPRSLRVLARAMRAMDVDPGFGFTSRRLAGVALGQLGLPGVGAALRRALETEALEFEGRPGAGLGIQFPVRSALLYALGECGDRAAAQVLAGYLGNTHGSALGGFYLPAMDALVKIGVPGPVVPLLGGDELVVANALGVLGAMGERARVRPFLTDPRPRVAAAARVALGEPPQTGALLSPTPTTT